MATHRLTPLATSWLTAIAVSLCVVPALTQPLPQTNLPPNTQHPLSNAPSPAQLAVLPLHSQRHQIAETIRSLKQSNQRWIEIDLSHQRLIAWQGKTRVYAVLISTGKSSSPTRSGVFAIQTRYRYARMRGADYDISNVPYTMYFSGNYAIHGAFWHRRFGTPVSHGCVNVAVNHARWLFYWAKIGTPVVVRY